MILRKKPHFELLLTAVLCSFLCSCATGPVKSAKGSPSPGKRLAKEAAVSKTDDDDDDDEVTESEITTAEKAELETDQKSGAARAKTVSDIENLTIDDVIRIEEPNTQTLYDNSRYDFPITMNSKVEGWIDYFTGRGRAHMERYLSRSSRYIPLMKEILKKAGMPEDLVYLALIESGFNLRAKSRAAAVGPWQFMKPTGRRYGLRVDAWVDERRDPIRSTGAAAKYLKDLYLMFESWYLAASAYNAGENKILRAIEQLHTNNYWSICQTRFFRRETKDYVPKLIAAAIIAKNPARYGFDEISYQDPLEFDTLTIDVPVKLATIAQMVNSTEDDIEDLNPELRRSMVPPGGPYPVRLPVGSRLLAERGLAEWRTKLATAELPQQHIVRAGETLKSLSRRYRLRLKELAYANNLSPKEHISPGLSLIIPSKRGALAAGSPRVARVKRSVSGGKEGTFITHVVKRGESLWSISEKYDVTVQELFRWNKLHRSRLNPGRRLRIRVKQKPDEQA